MRTSRAARGVSRIPDPAELSRRDPDARLWTALAAFAARSWRAALGAVAERASAWISARREFARLLLRGGS